NQLQQAITNLVVNAIQATPQGGTVSLAITRRPAAQAAGQADVETNGEDLIELTVVDAGPGIAPEHLPHVFEPFFTTKDVGEGTGLGLAVAYGIVREHGGWIEVSSELGHGARFSIVLPPASPPRPAERKAVA